MPKILGFKIGRYTFEQWGKYYWSCNQPEVDGADFEGLRQTIYVPKGVEDSPSRNKPLAQRKPATRRAKNYIARGRRTAGKVSRAK